MTTACHAEFVEASAERRLRSNLPRKRTGNNPKTVFLRKRLPIFNLLLGVFEYNIRLLSGSLRVYDRMGIERNSQIMKKAG